MLIQIDPKNPEKKLIKKVVQKLCDGKIIVYPTDTIYGLGCDVSNRKAIAKIYKIKKRAKIKQLSFICKDFKEIGTFANMSNSAFKFMKKLLPGPYTFILKASSRAPKNMIEKKRRTIGVRIPDNKICMEIVKELGNPIATTSVNITGEEIYNDPKKIEKILGGRVDLIIDGGKLKKDPSTVIDLTDNEPIVTRRGKGKIDI